MTSNRSCGTRARYVVDKCRCAPCTAANRAYASHRNRQTVYGRWSPFVDAGPAKAHVNRLRAAGLGTRTIAVHAGLDRKAVAKLPDRSRIRRATAAALLAVRADLASHAVIDATGTHRRLQALVAVGWAQARLGERLGMHPSNLAKVLHASHVTAARARAVRDLYDALWTGPPAATDPHTRQSIARARNYAAARGWALPMAWDDDAIDDPAATAEQPADAARRGRSPRLPDADELRWLVDQGETAPAIAQRFGVRENTVRNALYRSAA